MPLTIEERNNLDAAVMNVEAHTGAQVVVACVQKSDAYPELPWKAFAAFTALQALVLIGIEAFSPEWDTAGAAFSALLPVLAVGVGAALATVFVPPFARLFLDRTRAEVEVRQRAQALFLERELFATRDRCGVLLLVSEFERQMVILPDKGTQARVPDTVWQGVMATMRRPLARGKYADAIANGLMGLEAALVTHGFRAGEGRANELPNEIIEAKGA